MYILLSSILIFIQIFQSYSIYPPTQLDGELTVIFNNTQAECQRLYPNFTNVNSELIDFPHTCHYKCLDGNVPLTKLLEMNNGWTCGEDRTCFNGSCVDTEDITFCQNRVEDVVRVQSVNCRIFCTRPDAISYTYNKNNGTECHSSQGGRCYGGNCLSEEDQLALSIF